jgi:hypothetical protein
MSGESAPTNLSRRRLLRVAVAAGLGLAVGGLGPWLSAAARADSPIRFGVGPFDRALGSLVDHGYNLRSAGVAVNDHGDILIDGTERSRRVLYNYADRVGPYIDYLGDLTAARAGGRDLRFDGLLRVREELHVYTAPVFQPRFYGLRRAFRVGERFGFGLLPTQSWDPFGSRPWPAPGDFWGLAYAVDNYGNPLIWLIASTAEYRAISPTGASRAVRTEVVVERGGDASWLGYRADDAVLCTCLRRGSREFFGYPSFA